MCGFTQDTTDDTNWIRKNGATGSSRTGPTADHTLKTSSGFYMYTEASSPRQTGDKARLESPLQQPTPGGKCLEFWYHMFGSTMGSLVVYVKNNVQKSQIWKKSGNQGNLWLKARVTLKSAGNFKVRNTFKTSRSNLTSFTRRKRWKRDNSMLFLILQLPEM